MIDIQSSEGTSDFAIDRVGVCHLKYPVVIEDPSDKSLQSAVGDWNLSVYLPKERRGTHMSRLVDELHKRVTRPLNLETLYEWARGMEHLMGSSLLDISVDFVLFRLVHAPRTRKPSLLEQPMQFRVQTGEIAEKIMTVKTYAKTLCPCSKAISDRGAHNQRSLIATTLHFAPDAFAPSPLDIGALVESCASSPVYPILKREDEKHVTEEAYDRPGFVEDVVRAVAQKISKVEGLKSFVAQVTNFESIHAHDCFARISWTAPVSSRT